jgi:hypothetical protein
VGDVAGQGREAGGDAGRRGVIDAASVLWLRTSLTPLPCSSRITAGERLPRELGRR